MGFPLVPVLGNIFLGHRETKLLNKYNLKVVLSPFKKHCFICFNKSPIKFMKDAFYITLKANFFSKIFKFLS